MHKLMIALLSFAGLVLVMGGLGYIESAPLTIGHTLIGALICLMGFVLWIVAMLWHHFNVTRYDI